MVNRQMLIRGTTEVLDELKNLYIGGVLFDVHNQMTKETCNAKSST
jgi:hypothetical protein